MTVDQAGDLAGAPIFILFGCPNSGLLAGWPFADIAGALGVRLISYDRPGYGGSTAHPGRTVADAAGDVRVIADALGLARVGVWGFSFGGPHALACAALLPELVGAVVVAASPTPADLGGWSQEWIDDAVVNATQPEVARAELESTRDQLLGTTAEALAAPIRAGSPLMDDHAVTRLADWRAARYQWGVGPGIEGMWEDNSAIDQPWGFELEAIAQPVRLRHGQKDVVVPPSHSELLAKALPNAEVHYSDDTHMSLVARDPTDDWSWLLDRLSH